MSVISTESFTATGTEKTYTVSQDILSKSHCRIDFYYSGSDHEVYGTDWDLLGLSTVVFVDAPTSGYIVKITVSSDGTGLSAAPSNISDVAANIANVNTVAGISGDVTTVAGIHADVTTVANADTDIGIVATDISNVNSVATTVVPNIAEILLAENNAATATTKASEAAASASAASSSASAASSSASTATTQAGISTTQAGISTTQAGISTTQAGIATTKAGEASTSATNAASTLTTFEGQYVSQATEPASPVEGMLWFDETNNQMKVYNGSAWGLAGSSISGVNNSVEYTATAGQTTFVATYDIGYIDVYLNGVLLAKEDYTATDGANVVLDSGASVNDIVFIQSFGTFESADHYNKVASDARYEPIDSAYTKSESDSKYPLATDTYTKAEVNAKPSGFKNHIINGGFDVWQRGTHFDEDATVNNYNADRWRSEGYPQTITDIDKTTLGYKNALTYNVSTSASNGGNSLVQRIENVRALSGKTVTFSGKIKGDSAFNITIDVGNSSRTGFSVTTGEQTFSITTTFGDLTGGTFVTVRFNYASGITGAITLADIQLEEGSVATPFEQRPYGLELSLCQRYYEKSEFFGTTITATNMSVLLYHGYAKSTAQWEMVRKDFAIKKRITPAINVSDANGSVGFINHFTSAGGTTTAGHTPYTTYLTTEGFHISDYITSGIYGFSCEWEADAEL